MEWREEEREDLQAGLEERIRPNKKRKRREQ